MAVFTQHYLVNVLFFHVIARHAKRKRRSLILMIINSRTISFSELASEVVIVILVTMRTPVVDVSVTKACVSETL